MYLLPTDEQVQIVDTVAAFLSNLAPVERLRPDKHGQIGNPDVSLWPQLGELGFLGLGLAEDDGGIGLGAVEEALVFREYGRNLVSTEIFGITLGAHLAAESNLNRASEIVAGNIRVGLANPRGAITSENGLSGSFHLMEAGEAELIVVLAPDGPYLLPASAFEDGESCPGMDSHNLLRRATLRNAQPLSSVASSNAHRPRALLLSAAYASGLSKAALDMAVDYAKMREQFGKLIGSFQAVKHKCADMAIAAEVASCQVDFASVVVAENRSDALYHATAAKLVAVDAALKNGATNIQVHGAIGFTAETDAHVYLKRAHTIDVLGGDLRKTRASMIGQAAPA
ncbi:acyl-CoA dehydrogenase [Hyphomonas johnsonii]|uniref:Acyl-CoA dehydrogenase n=1 Tax=Hyphomonas johnsonii MHS-2 TaxID=1280950 RepID=A0A059FRD9_9PROT|nr:acyl-CoA dehydrogenase [Hyphomonas johnsonii]KCZ93239.1 acyl-CoA dehydrogenase [Hyphomonas johnsonii MHS-2]